MREASARAAELTSAAATKAVPLARKAGEATADASGKLAVKSKAWASDLRASASHDGDAAGDAAHDAASAAGDAADTAADTVTKAADSAADAIDDATPPA